MEVSGYKLQVIEFEIRKSKSLGKVHFIFKFSNFPHFSHLHQFRCIGGYA